MNKRTFDDVTRKTLGLSAFDDALRGLTTASKIFEAERLAVQIADRSGLADLQRQLHESLKVPESLLTLAERENAWRWKLEEGVLGSARHLVGTLREISLIENTALENLKRTSATAADYLGQYQATAGGVIEQARKELEFRNYLTEDSMSRIAKEAALGLGSMASAWNDQLSQITKGLSDSYDIFHTAHHSLAAEDINRLTVGIREAQLIAFPPVAAMANQIADALRLKIPASALDATFTGELFERLRQAEAATSASEREQFLTEFLAWVWGKFQQLPVKRVVLHVLFEIVFLTINQMVSNWDADQREQHWKETLSQLEQRLEEKMAESQDKVLRKLEELQQAPATRKYHVVTEQVRLREKPSTKARKIKSLSPNQMVEQIEQQGQWLHVEFFDYVDGKLKRGWVYKRYLQLVE